eukprot:7458571-Alexandrium_andersonii.AAC.1
MVAQAITQQCLVDSENAVDAFPAEPGPGPAAPRAPLPKRRRLLTPARPRSRRASGAPAGAGPEPVRDG